MGIRGLSTYVAENSDQLLKPHKLCNTFLVVDGNNIASHLYTWVMRSDSIFGGDYDEFYKIVKQFFNNLKKCRVTPIVLFDGGYEEKKLKTVFSRAVMKMLTLRSFAKTFSKIKFFPLFMKLTFFQVMEDLEIFCFQCELEADIEIAAVARALGCPVLSYDSDFYVFDVLYIPFSSVCNEVFTTDNATNKTKLYLDCLIYDVNNLLEHFGLEKSLLPIAATLLGNDYIDCTVFQKFFNHICLPKSKKLSYTQKKIHGLFEWLKNENVESATKLILGHLENKIANKFMNAINRSIKEYSKMSVSPSLFDKLNKLLTNKNISNFKLEKENSETCLPSDICNNYYECKIEKLIVDMIRLGTYYSPLQVEYVCQQSSHFHSCDLIKAIYKIINTLTKKPFRPLKMYLAYKNQYVGIKLVEENNFLTNFNIKNILYEPVEVRLDLIYEILKLSNEEIDTTKYFCGSWVLFVICFLYWIRTLDDSISLAHVHALILMAVGNQIVQKNVGYYRNTSKFNKKKGLLLEELSDTELVVTPEEDLSFEELIDKVTLFECLKIQQTLISYRQTQDESKKVQHYISTIHLFACFQSCLFYLIQLNALLNFPLPPLKINEFYSGTLLFNFYFKISQKRPFKKFGINFLKDYPNVAALTKFLQEKLCKFSSKQNCTGDVNKTKRKKKKNKKVTKECEVELIEVSNSPNESDYDGENNVFALLRNID